jgi:hypothetical protein
LVELRPAPRRSRWTGILCGAAILPLAGCVAASYPPALPNGCIAYQNEFGALVVARGCATQLSAHWAVMAKHESQLAPPGAIADPDYDLVFFPRDGDAPKWADALTGEQVTAIGNPKPLAPSRSNPDLETQAGRVLAVATWQGQWDDKEFPAIYFSGPIRPGYSGGPVVNARGAVVGMTVEALLAVPMVNRTGAELEPGDGIALPAGLIEAEFARLVPKAGAGGSPEAPQSEPSPRAENR